MKKRANPLNIIYVLKNTKNNKVYVGQTWWSLKDRWNNGHGYINCLKLENAMQKYGKESFYYEALTFCATQKAADYWEQYFIQKYNRIAKGYNISTGGKSIMLGRKHSKESIAKMSKSHIGSRAHLGKSHSKETKEILRKASTGNKNSLGRILSQESKDKISKSNMGHHRSIETEFKPRLSYEIAEQIRQDKKNGMKTKDIASKYNISGSLVSMIVHNKRWIKNG